MMLTLLAPDIIEVVLDRHRPAELGVHEMLEGFPAGWGEQRAFFFTRQPGEQPQTENQRPADLTLR